MRHTSRASCAIASATIAVWAAGSAANGDIIGFNNLVGWSYNQRDAGVAAQVGAGFVQITTGGAKQVRDIWYNTPQDISRFSASFTYRAANIGAASGRQGVAFILQTDTRGAAALGTGFSSTGFGYDDVTPSAAVTIELDTGPALSYTGFYRNGSLGGGSTVLSPLNGFDLRDIDVTIDYDGSLLTVAMRDTVNTSPTRTYVVSPSFALGLGSTTALIGFGASSGLQHGVDQFISNFRFTSVPGPTPLRVLGLMCYVAVGRRRR